MSLQKTTREGRAKLRSCSSNNKQRALWERIGDGLLERPGTRGDAKPERKSIPKLLRWACNSQRQRWTRATCALRGGPEMCTRGSRIRLGNEGATGAFVRVRGHSRKVTAYGILNFAIFNKIAVLKRILTKFVRIFTKMNYLDNLSRFQIVQNFARFYKIFGKNYSFIPLINSIDSVERTRGRRGLRRRRPAWRRRPRATP